MFRFLPVYILSLLVFFSVQLAAQIEPKAEPVSINFLELGNHKCDSAVVHLKNKDIKGANKLYQAAIKDYKKVVKEDPKSQAAFFRLAIAQAKTEDHKNAIKNFDMAVSLDTAVGAAYRERG
ncbi:MAG: hypothetical protein V4549_12880, partial [Bacteroidota bacterium]